jgi:hypothetical protein
VVGSVSDFPTARVIKPNDRRQGFRSRERLGKNSSNNWAYRTLIVSRFVKQILSEVAE